MDWWVNDGCKEEKKELKESQRNRIRKDIEQRNGEMEKRNEGSKVQKKCEELNNKLSLKREGKSSG